jgi:predicted dehydrogenase
MVPQEIRIGIVGCGGMARHHGRVFDALPGVRIASLAEPNQQNVDRYILETVSDKTRPPTTYTDYREMLSRESLDGVVIVTPHNQHFTQAIAALDAGCHVLVEKPMVINTHDAHALIAHAKKCSKIVSVAFPGPFTSEFQYIRAHLAEGGLGDLSVISGVCAQPWIQNQTGTWRVDPLQSGGGNLYDSGAHLFNALLYLTGLSVSEVYAYTDSKGEAVEVSGVVMMKFSDGSFGTASVSGDATVFEQGVFLQGSRGSIKTSIYGGTMEHWQEGRTVNNPAVPAVASVQENFRDVIMGTSETPSPALLGLHQARLMDAIYASAAQGKPVHVIGDN